MRILYKLYSTDNNSSKLYDEHGFYKAFSNDFKRAQSHVIIESPFVTVRRSKELTAIAGSPSVKVTIYTRDPTHHEGNMVHEAGRGIEILERAGFKVVQCADMRHRKIAIVDDNVLWEGSLNMLSQNGSREVMRRTQSRQSCSQMRAFTGVAQ